MNYACCSLLLLKYIILVVKQVIKNRESSRIWKYFNKGLVEEKGEYALRNEAAVTTQQVIGTQWAGTGIFIIY